MKTTFRKVHRLKPIVLAVMILSGLCTVQGQQYADRLVWIWDSSLRTDSGLRQILEIIDTAAQHGYNGAVLQDQLDYLSAQDSSYFRRLDSLKRVCDRLGIELIPAVFSVGYATHILSRDHNLAEGFPVQSAPFTVQGIQAAHIPDTSVRMFNGGFELFNGNTLTGFQLQEMPGSVSFVDTLVRHSGRASLRMENFIQSGGYGRIMQEINLLARRCYRVSLWLKTDGLLFPNNFLVLALAMENNRLIAKRRFFEIQPTRDWFKITMIFNSLASQRVSLYAGVWGATGGRFWIDDWVLEEIGPLNVLRRPGTPVAVTNMDSSTIYTEGVDYAPLVDTAFNNQNVDRPPVKLRILPGSRIMNGQTLRVSWYHSQVFSDGQVTACMGEPALYNIFDDEARRLWERLHPRRVFLTMDEIRMGGSCNACRYRNMAELLGECITRQVQVFRTRDSLIQVYIWSDMLDPNHNAILNYELVEGDFRGSWNYVPKDLVIAVWGREPRESSMQFFAQNHFQILVACYYDADNLNDVTGWIQLARRTPGVRGFMYTTWQRRYEFLAAFGDLVWGTTSLDEGKEMNSPLYFQLQQNYPNPFNPTTTIKFSVGSASGRMGEPARTTLKVYDVLGREVVTLVDEPKHPGAYTVTWDASTVPSGVYFVRLTAGSFSQTRKAVVMK
jgi:hypothetical protein